MSERDCEHCIWFDQCGSDSVCDGFTSGSEIDNEERSVAEYERDLKRRHKLYMRQVKEES